MLCYSFSFLNTANWPHWPAKEESYKVLILCSCLINTKLSSERILRERLKEETIKVKHFKACWDAACTCRWDLLNVKFFSHSVLWRKTKNNIWTFFFQPYYCHFSLKHLHWRDCFSPKKGLDFAMVYSVCVSAEHSSSKQGFVQILPKKTRAASTFCQWLSAKPCLASLVPLPTQTTALLTRMAFIPEAMPYTSPARRAAYEYSFKSSFSNLSNK